MSRKKSLKNVQNEKKFLNIAKTDILSWSEVSEIHKTRHGIYQKNEKVISLLTDFGKINACYPDYTGENENVIFYTGAGRRGDQKLDVFNRALFNAVESQHAVPLFNKLAVGRWQLTGFWQVAEGRYIYDESQKRMVWKFRLEKISDIEKQKFEI